MCSKLYLTEYLENPQCQRFRRNKDDRSKSMLYINVWLRSAILLRLIPCEKHCGGQGCCEKILQALACNAHIL